MMRNIALITAFFCVILVNAQESSKQDFITTENIVGLTPNAKKLNILPIQNRMEYNLLSAKEMLVPNYSQPKLAFNRYENDLKQNFSYLLYSNSNVLHNFGGNYEAGSLLIYQPSDKLFFSIGVSAVKYSINGNSYNDFLINSSMTYQFNSWLKLYLYGQYSMNSQKNTLAGGYNLSPQSCYGAMLLIHVLDNKKYSVDMNIGAERLYNPLNKKWEMNYRLGPDIRLK